VSRRDQPGLFADLPEPPRASGRRAAYFFALWPDRAVRRRLASAAARVPLGEGGAVYRIRPERLHLTLAWLGEIDSARVAAARRAADEVQARPFLLRLDSLGHFPGPNAQWFGCQRMPPALARLKAELDRELLGYGLPVAAEAFVPHVTVQRNVRTPVEVPAEAIGWPVTEFALLRSARSGGKADGYRVVGRWGLEPLGVR
jgi:2'-5' RNA ligase